MRAHPLHCGRPYNVCHGFLDVPSGTLHVTETPHPNGSGSWWSVDDGCTTGYSRVDVLAALADFATKRPPAHQLDLFGA